MAATTIQRIPGLAVRLVAALAVLTAVACAAHKPSEKSKAVSPVPPTTRPFAERVVPAKTLPRIASKGGCEPTYRNGTKGACVAGKPCRGYGVIDEAGHELCECYLKRGGCESGFRCEPVRSGCVPDDPSHADP
jgi:hypothetical protein